MNRSFLLRALLVLSVLAVGVPACTTHESDSIRPQATLPSALPLTVADARSWYQAQAGPLKTAASAARSSTTEPVSGPLPIDWASAVDTTANAQAVVFAPVRDFGRRFAEAGYQAYRYLLVTRSVPTQLSGMVVEVFIKDSHQPSKALERALLARLYNHYRSAAETLPGNFTGYAFFYTADYRYLAGTGYAKGKALAGKMRLTRAIPVVAVPPKKSSTANKTTSCTLYLIKQDTSSSYYENICQSEPYFGEPDTDPGQPIFNDPGYGGTPDSPTTGDGPTGGNGTNPGSVTTIIPNLLPCVSPSLSSLQNLKGNDIGGLFRYFSTTSYSTWVIQSGDIPNDSQGRQRNALTSQSAGMPADYIVTTINNSFANTATDVAISRTLIHESMHAYLMLWAYSQGMNVNVTTSQLVDGYLGAINPNDPSGQHDAMVNIINQMASALQMRFPTLPSEYAKNLFWAGLTETREYASLSAAQRAAITAAATAELLSQATALGTKACN